MLPCVYQPLSSIDTESFGKYLGWSNSNAVQAPRDTQIVCRNKLRGQLWAVGARSEATSQREPNDRWALSLVKGAGCDLSAIDEYLEVRLFGGVIGVGHIEFSFEVILLALANLERLRKVELEVGRGSFVGDRKSICRIIARSLNTKRFVLGVFWVRRYDGINSPGGEPRFEVTVLHNGRWIGACSWGCRRSHGHDGCGGINSCRRRLSG